ncbi:uncharacterized protein UV8b_04834 [Ustilaginoidea virens]|uniref:Uncharacterized protein n=1 Tax=Ustilaginoidea virens TaxID=1159556 RepID=A0A8E5HSA8_USTVR|nr:uncharacterized protein UV8b_04834 [Ustilaginoidea virens]QUC20593.1 hypothetical protein UV8b_04834 [Ustilaginoidea virens]
MTLGLSEHDKPGGKVKLADQLEEIIRTTACILHRFLFNHSFSSFVNPGFFYLANIDLARFQINPQYSIVKKFLALEPQEKPRYRAPLEQGSYNGYRPLGSVEILPGLRDNLAFYLTLSNSSRRRSGPSPISYAATCVSEGGVAVNMGDIPQ